MTVEANEIVKGLEPKLTFLQELEEIANEMEKSGTRACFDDFEVCNAHGEYQTNKDLGNGKVICINHMCPVCHSELKAKEIIGKSGIQKRFLNCSFRNYRTETEEQSYVSKRLQAFAENFPRILKSGSSIVLSGSVGTGKTHLSSAVANQLALSGYTSCLRTVSELVQSVRDGWNRANGKTSSQVIDEYVEFDLLIIDEFGVQSGTNNELNIVFDIVNARYAEQKPIMALTNLTEEQFKHSMGERIHDRLTHNGALLTMDWESYRSK